MNATRGASARAAAERRLQGLLPPIAQGADEDVRRQARLVIAFSLAISVCGPFYGIIYFALGMPVSAFGALGAGVFLLATPFLQKRFNSVVLGAHLVSAACYGGLAVITAPMGGLAAPALAWFAVVPVTALMLGGQRPGVIWSLLSLAIVFAYFAIDVLGHPLAVHVPRRWLPMLRLSLNAGLIGLVAYLAWVYESNKNLMRGRLQASHSALSQARDEARSAHEEARLVLDHVTDGLLVADRDGRVSAEQSRAVVTLVGAAREGAPIWDVFGKARGDFPGALRAAWEQVFDGLLPIEVTVDQLPRSCKVGERCLALAYVPVLEQGECSRLLVVTQDETLSLQAAQAAQERSEQLTMLDHLSRDGRYVIRSFGELARLIGALEGRALSWADQQRALHTLKGNAAVLGLGSLARHCHELEEQIREHRQVALTELQVSQLLERWQTLRSRLGPLLDVVDEDAITVAREEYQGLLRELQHCHAPQYERLRRWAWEPTRTHLARLAQQAQALAARLGRGDLRVAIECDDVWLDPERWSPFWAAAVHLVRNAVDHGIEEPAARAALGKPTQGRLSLRAHRTDHSLIVEVSDDGRGISWDQVRAKARALGLEHSTPQQLEAALFHDGLSTREVVSEISGRGIGMAAVLATARDLGGEVRVESVRDQGTCVRFAFPLVRVSMAA